MLWPGAQCFAFPVVGLGFLSCHKQHKASSEAAPCSPSAELETSVRAKAGTHTARVAQTPFFENSPKDLHALMAVSRTVPVWKDKSTAFWGLASAEQQGQPLSAVSLLLLGCFGSQR